MMAPSATVGPNSSTTMVVRFTPTVDGGSASTLTLTNNDLNESSYVLNLQAVAICTGTITVTNPLGVVAAAVFVAGILVGADSMSRAVAVPTYIADVIVAIALICMLVATLLTQYRIRR